MSDTVPTVEPTAATAGDTWEWQRSYGDYPSSDGWTLAYYLQGPGKIATIEGVAQADDSYLVTIPPATTKDLPPGAYQLHGFVEDRDGETVDERHRVYHGQLLVAADPAQLTAPRQSHTEFMLDTIRLQLEGRLPQDRETIAIDGTQITRIPILELKRLEGIYAEQLRIELGGALIQSVVTKDPI